MFDPNKLNYIKANDYLQTRVRHPRKVMPNFALYCDWIIWDANNIYVDFDIIPKTIYVRSEPTALNYFLQNVIRRLNSEFILITTSHDTPMPIGFKNSFNFNWQAIIKNKYLKAWFTENRDTLHPKIKPIPLGIPHPDLPSWVVGDTSTSVWTDEFLESVPLFRSDNRIKRIFGCWYSRDNHPSGTCPKNFNERQLAYEYLIGKKDLFDWYQPGMSRLEFIRKLGAYQFVLCPHGGGLDPNPRCWEALIMRSIPIVRRNSMTESLEHLPIAFVDDWTEITQSNLKHWEEKYLSILQSSNIEYFMSNSYFFNKITECFNS